jgi:hypothetical protein
MYQRLHAMGLEPRRGETVHVSGGGESNTPATLSVDSDYAEGRREYARYVASEIRRVARRVDRLRQGLERSTGPTPGYRQPDSVPDGPRGVGPADFEAALAKQAQRLERGEE